MENITSIRDEDKRLLFSAVSRKKMGPNQPPTE